ncbi:2588_t:CDS:1, partial [Ambispora leptoticha]
VNEFWTEFSQKLSHNLCSVYLNCLRVTPSALYYFLSNRDNPIKMIEFGRHVYLCDQHLEVILDCYRLWQVSVTIYSRSFKRMEKFDSSLVKQLEEWARLVPSKGFRGYHPFYRY